MLLLGVAATGAGSLGRVPLAVITLTALAAFEAVTALPAAAVQLGQATRPRRPGSRRCLTRPTRSADPAARSRRRAAGDGPICAAAVSRTAGRTRSAVRAIDLDLEPGRRVALVGPTGAGKSTVAAVLFRFADLAGGTAR